MLPESQNFPPGLRQTLVGVQVSFHICSQLLVPVVSIYAHSMVVVGTAMPKASVDHDCNSLFRKYDVGGSPQTAKGSVVHPESQTCCVEGATDGHFRGRIAGTDSLHIASAAGRRGPRNSGAHSSNIVEFVTPRRLCVCWNRARPSPAGSGSPSHPAVGRPPPGEECASTPQLPTPERLVLAGAEQAR